MYTHVNTLHIRTCVHTNTYTHTIKRTDPHSTHTLSIGRTPQVPLARGLSQPTRRCPFTARALPSNWREPSRVLAMKAASMVLAAAVAAGALLQVSVRVDGCLRCRRPSRSCRDAQQNCFHAPPTGAVLALAEYSAGYEYTYRVSRLYML
jgi:hypothetical protein